MHYTNSHTFLLLFTRMSCLDKQEYGLQWHFVSRWCCVKQLHCWGRLSPAWMCCTAYHHISKTVEASRVHLFDIVTQYRAIFTDDDLLTSSTDDRPNDSVLFHSWVVRKVCLNCSVYTAQSLVTAWTSNNRWRPTACIGRPLIALFAHATKLGPGACGARHTRARPPIML